MTVEGSAPLLNASDASVSTVIGNRFVENMPLNGRSFSSLIELTPGVVLDARRVCLSRASSVSMASGRTPITSWWMA